MKSIDHAHGSRRADQPLALAEPARDREQQRDREVGGRVGQHAGRVGDRDAAARGRRPRRRCRSRPRRSRRPAARRRRRRGTRRRRGRGASSRRRRRRATASCSSAAPARGPAGETQTSAPLSRSAVERGAGRARVTTIVRHGAGLCHVPRGPFRPAPRVTRPRARARAPRRAPRAHGSPSTVVALRPIRPMRHIGGASGPSPPPTSMPCSASSRAWTALPSMPSGTRTAVSGAIWRRVGDELEPAGAQRGLQVGAGGGVPCPARLEPLLEHQPQRLVQRVDGQDRRRVVVDGGAIDPVAAQQLEVEAERHRGAALADPAPGARRDRDGRHAGRRGEALLRAAVGVVDAPAADVERDPAERGDAVGEQQHVVAEQRGPELLQRVQRARRRLGVDDGDEPRVRVPVERVEERRVRARSPPTAR